MAKEEMMVEGGKMTGGEAGKEQAEVVRPPWWALVGVCRAAPGAAADSSGELWHDQTWSWS